MTDHFEAADLRDLAQKLQARAIDWQKPPAITVINMREGYTVILSRQP